jgi:hypothetical protein
MGPKGLNGERQKSNRGKGFQLWRLRDSERRPMPPEPSNVQLLLQVKCETMAAATVFSISERLSRTAHTRS